MGLGHGCEWLFGSMGVVMSNHFLPWNNSLRDHCILKLQHLIMSRFTWIPSPGYKCWADLLHQWDRGPNNTGWLTSSHHRAILPHQPHVRGNFPQHQPWERGCHQWLPLLWDQREYFCIIIHSGNGHGQSWNFKEAELMPSLVRVPTSLKLHRHVHV